MSKVTESQDGITWSGWDKKKVTNIHCVRKISSNTSTPMCIIVFLRALIVYAHIDDAVRVCLFVQARIPGIRFLNVWNKK